MLTAVVYKLSDRIGSISLMDGDLTAEPPDDRSLRRVMLQPVYDPQIKQMVKPAVDPERFLRVLPLQYRSPYFWVALEENPGGQAKAMCEPGQTAAETDCTPAKPPFHGPWDWPPSKEFPEPGVDLRREEMPQIKRKHLEHFLFGLRQKGISVLKTWVDPNVLKPTQVDTVDEESELKHEDKPILVSADNYIVDGHHHWKHALNKGKQVPIVQVGLHVHSLLDAARTYERVKFKDKNGKKLSKAPASFDTLQTPMMAQGTQSIYVNHDGTWKKERAAIHKAAIKSFYEKVTEPPDHRNTVYFTGGGPGSGKSTLIDKFYDEVGFPPPEEAPVMDPDAVKERLPEYQERAKLGDKGAVAYVHAEGGTVAWSGVLDALHKGYSPIFDTTGDSGIESLRHLTSMFRRGGAKRLVASYASPLSFDEAISRVDARVREGTDKHRILPPEFIRAKHRAVAQNWLQAAKEGLYDDLKLWSTAVPKGKPPTLVARARGGHIEVSDQEGYNKFVEMAAPEMAEAKSYGGRQNSDRHPDGHQLQRGPEGQRTADLRPGGAGVSGVGGGVVRGAKAAAAWRNGPLGRLRLKGKTPGTCGVGQNPKRDHCVAAHDAPQVDMNKVRRIAASARTACDRTVVQNTDPEDRPDLVHLGGLCEFYAGQLARRFNENGIKATVVDGHYANSGHHSWVELEGGVVVDLTATQFDSDLPKVVIGTYDQLPQYRKKGICKPGQTAAETGCTPAVYTPSARPPARLHPQAPAHQLSDLFSRIAKPDGGFTYQAVTRRQPKIGYALSVYPERSFAKDFKAMRPADLAQYVLKNKDLLSKPDHYLGAWNDPATGKVYFDVSVVKSDPKEAEKLAREKDQIAYFDLAAGKSVTVNPEATSGGAAIDTAADYKKNAPASKIDAFLAGRASLPISSTWHRSARYDPRTRELVITFKDGWVGVYGDVSWREANSYAEDPSQGEWLHDNFKEGYNPDGTWIHSKPYYGKDYDGQETITAPVSAGRRLGGPGVGPVGAAARAKAHGGGSGRSPFRLHQWLAKSAGQPCAQGERADLTGCIPQQSSPGQYGQAHEDMKGHVVQSLGITIDATPTLTPEQKAHYKAALAQALARFPPKAVERLGKNILKATFYPSVQEVTKMAIAIDPEVAKRAGAGEKFSVNGGYLPPEKALHLDGDAEKKPGSGVYNYPAHWIYSHELTHAIDGPEGMISRRQEWIAAWFQEVLMGGAISDYAAASPQEGLAEFGRMVYTGPYNRQKLEQDMPKMSAVWTSFGLWP